MARVRPAGFIALLLAAYLVSRLAALLTLPIFYDEAHYTYSAMLIGRDPVHTDPFVEVAYWGVPPLFTWLAAPLTRFISEPLLAGRVASTLIGLIGILGIWKCGRLMGGLAVAATASTLYLLCPFFLFYQRMAMVDGLLATIGAFGLYWTMLLAREPSRTASLMLGMCLALAGLTKITGPLFILLPLCAIISAAPKSRPEVIRHSAVAGFIGLSAALALLAIPQGASLIAVAQQQQRLAGSLSERTIGQVTTIVESLWIYISVPVLVAAAVGATRAWRRRETRLVPLWALFCVAPFAAIHLSPRYLLPAAVPLLLLAAHGIVGLWAPANPMHTRKLRTLAAVLSASALISTAGSDVPLIIDPAQAAMPSADHFQYISGWPAGYPLLQAIRDARAMADGRDLTMVASLQNPPGDALAVLVGRDKHVRLVYRDFGTLEHRDSLVGNPIATFVIACSPFGQVIDARRAGLTLVDHVPNGDGHGGVDLYVPEVARAPAMNVS